LRDKNIFNPYFNNIFTIYMSREDNIFGSIDILFLLKFRTLSQMTPQNFE